jgi:Tfp pilus assembly protein PilN
MTAKIQQNVAPRRHQSYSTPSLFTRRQLNQSNWSQGGLVEHSTITITVALVAVIGVSLLGFFYLQQVFNTASQGTNIQQLETQIMSLQERQKELELEGARLRSIQAVEQQVEKLNLVASEDVAYLAADTGKVALSVE